MSIPVIAIFDVGKTNKKLFLFDEDYIIQYESSHHIAEILDEDGDPCDDINAITKWISLELESILTNKSFTVKAINVAAYGASFVHLDRNSNVLTPLYNYLKPFPKTLQDKFYKTYGGETLVSLQSASPVLGSLNSGLQLYRLKHEKPALFNTITCSLHLPQYISHVITLKEYSDITSIGSHTLLWDFNKKNYHQWVFNEGIDRLLPKRLNADEVVPSAFMNADNIPVGSGLHDSSAALIPYLSTFSEPFVLISTGTWCISMNPFNDSPLTEEELKRDCLCYLSHQATPIKAARLFAGHEHEVQCKRISVHFNQHEDYYKLVDYNSSLAMRPAKLIDSNSPIKFITSSTGSSAFGQRTLSNFSSYEEAYHQLMADIIAMQIVSTNLILSSNVTRIFVDGGFSKNAVYMSLLALAFPKIKIFGASVAQASALGAALAIRKHWNKKPVSKNIIELNHFSPIK
jgi:sugar (pentulose or hexulose) kinase